MSRHFYPPGEFADDEESMRVPARVYAMIDHTEPDLAIAAASVLLAFDAVDADQMDGFSPDPVTHFSDPHSMEAYWRRYWQDILRPPGFHQADPFEDLDLFRVEIVLDRASAEFRRLQGDLYLPPIDPAGRREGRWLEIDFGPGCQTPAEVYPRMFGPPLDTFANFRPTSIQAARSLSATFTLDHLPQASSADAATLLWAPGEAHALAVYDVGPGGACALLDANDVPWLYFDLGCGVYRNARTTPRPLRFCACGFAPVTPVPPRSEHRIVLSHWDADHWAGVFADPANIQFLGGNWLVPYQGPTPGIPHIALVHDIVRSQGRVLVYDPPAGHIDRVALSDGRVLNLLRASGTDRNDSGFALCVDDRIDPQSPPDPRSWLLTGDAAYAHLLGTLGARVYEAVVVPHHGAAPASSTPVAKPHAPTRRLVYSFGANNAHGRRSSSHPRPESVDSHAAAGWDVTPWQHVAAPGHRVATRDIRATSRNGPGCEHLDGVFIEWGLPGFGHRRACNGVHCSASLSQR